MVNTALNVLKHERWQCLVVDEAHRLKSHTSKFFESLQQLDCLHTILLTGTPLQNNTDEAHTHTRTHMCTCSHAHAYTYTHLQLWSLLNFIDTDRFESLEQFKQEFGTLKESNQVAQPPTRTKNRNVETGQC